MEKPRAAVIGYGFAGKSFHSYLVGLTPDLELCGVASRNPETRQRIVQERGCHAYDSFESVIADPSVDLVVLATPNYTHADLAVRAMEAGKHVVTDKVMCLTLADCDRMIAAAQRQGVFLSVFQNRRWDGDFLTLRKLLDDGKLGDLRWLEMAWQGFGRWGGWRGEASAGGGRLYDLGAHLIDQLVLLFPQAIESVYCRMRHDWPQGDTESHALVVVSFAGGRTAISDTSDMAAVRKPRIYASGTGGAFVKYGLDPQEKAMIAEDIDAAVEPEENYGRLADGKTETLVPTLPGRWRNYYENVADVLLNGAEPLVKLPEVRRAIAVIDGAFESGRTGQTVKLDLPALGD